MKATIYTAWINALESGEYKRTDGKFCANDGHSRRHCCLGVLWEVLEKDFPILAKEIRKSEYEARNLGPDEPFTRFPEWETFGSFHPFSANVLGLADHQNKLIQLNDSSIEDGYWTVVAYIKQNVPAE